ncbi:MAG: Mpo1-like protein [Flavobacteriaceae bacterium]|nr:Mpo1-like protein [Flavobacteriaceae bacterium]
MKTLDQWFDEYALSHQNPTNKKIHYLCVPAIFFSIIGLLMSIPTGYLENILPFDNPLIENWATVTLLFVLLFYLRLSVITTIKVLLFASLCVWTNHLVGQYISLALFSLIVFVIAWIGQFYGHKLEGKKPSFLKDLQFLLIGPAWVFENMFKTNTQTKS